MQMSVMIEASPLLLSEKVLSNYGMLQSFVDHLIKNCKHIVLSFIVYVIPKQFFTS
jgi:hypothetical protein